MYIILLNCLLMILHIFFHGKYLFFVQSRTKKMFFGTKITFYNQNALLSLVCKYKIQKKYHRFWLI